MKKGTLKAAATVSGFFMPEVFLREEREAPEVRESQEVQQLARIHELSEVRGL
ncbi:MAG: hypothetical protein ACKVIZ_04755 [Pseudomonadales bacterium]